MKYFKKGVLDIVIYNIDIIVINILNKVYNYIVNGKIVIEWIIDQYNVSIDKKFGILDDLNEFSEDLNYILNLFLLVIIVSMKIFGLIDKLLDFEVLD